MASQYFPLEEDDARDYAPQQQIDVPPELGSMPEDTYAPNLDIIPDTQAANTAPVSRGFDPNALEEYIPGQAAQPTPPTEDMATPYEYVDLDASDSSASDQAIDREEPSRDWEWMRDTRNTLRAAVDGIMWGWSDEAASGIFAAYDSMTGGDYSTSYDMMIDQFQTERDDFSSNFPVVDFVANMAGGVVSGGPAVAAAKAARTAAGASTSLKLGAAGTVATAEGGIAGAGSARQGEKLEGAKTGAVINVGLQGGLGALTGGMRRGFTQKAGPLEEVMADGTTQFKPLNLAAEQGSLPQQAWQRLFGASWPGRNAIKAQSDEYIAKFKVDHAGLEADLAAQIKRQKQLEKSAAKAAKDADKLRKQARAEAKAAHTAAAATAKRDARRRTREAQRAFTNRLATQMKESVDTIRGTFQDISVKQALSPDMRPALRELIVGSLPQRRNQLLQNWWRKKGFSFMKGKSYEMGDVHKAMSDTVDNSFATNKTDLHAMVKEITDSMHLDDKGMIDGEDFLDLRNEIARRANGMSPRSSDDFVNRQVIRELVHDLDKSIELGADKVKFKSSKTQYRTMTIHRDAVENASKELRKNGDFEPQDWLDALNGVSTRAAGRGEGVLIKRAKDADDAHVSATKYFEDLTDQGMKEMTDDLDDLLVANQVQLAESLRDIKRGTTQADIDLDSAGVAAQQGRAEAAEAANAQMEGAIKEIQEHIKKLEDMSPNNDSWFLQYAATTFIGTTLLGLVGGIGGALAGIAGGVTASKLASLKGVQKVIAGQAGWQDVNNVLDKYIRSATRALIMNDNTGVNE